MAQNPSANAYLRTQVMTASPERLQLMLYEGAIRFSEHAKQAIADGDIEAAHHNLLRAQRIITELISALRPEVDAALCENMASLHSFVYRCLIQANMERDVQAVEDALRILYIQRDTWQALIAKAAEERAEGQAVPDVSDPPQPNSTFSATG